MNKAGKQTHGCVADASGFSLIEMAIAIAIIAFTFIGIIGLLGVGMASNQTSSQQTVATNIAASIVADLRSTPSYSATGASPRFGIPTPTSVASNPPLTVASGAKLYYLYFDNNLNTVPNVLPYVPYTSAQSSAAAGAAFVANVYISEIAAIGPGTTAPLLPQTTYMARIIVSWPAQATEPAARNVEIITQFRIN